MKSRHDKRVRRVLAALARAWRRVRHRASRWMLGALAVLIALATLALVAALTRAARRPAAVHARCHPSYDPCVPIDSDVDCAGGGGNGPSYVRGPVRVIGPDEYGLDRDRDGIGCE